MSAALAFPAPPSSEPTRRQRRCENPRRRLRPTRHVDSTGCRAERTALGTAVDAGGAVRVAPRRIIVGCGRPDRTMARRVGAEQTAKLFAHATWSCSRTILGRGADRRHGAQDPKSKRRYAGPVRTPRSQRLTRRSPRRPSSLPRGGLGHVQFFVDCHRNDGSSVLGIFRRWRDPRLGLMLDCPNADQLVRGIRMHLEWRPGTFCHRT